MNHAQFGHLRRTFRSIRCHHHIMTGSAKTNQLTQRRHASSGAGPPHRLMPKFGNDPCNDFSILVLADQHVRAGAPVADWNHQLLGMPKRQNDVATVAIERIHVFLPLRFDTHGPTQSANDCGADRREYGQLEPGFDRLEKLVTHSAHPEIAWHGAVCSGRREARAHHVFPFRQWCPDSAR